MIGSVLAVWPKTLKGLPPIFPLLVGAIFFSFWFSSMHAAYLVAGRFAAAQGVGPSGGPLLIAQGVATAFASFFSTGAALIALRMIIKGESLRVGFDNTVRLAGDVVLFALINTAVALAEEWATRQLYMQRTGYGIWVLVPMFVHSAWGYLLLRALCLCAAESPPAVDALSKETELIFAAPLSAFVLWLPLFGARIASTLAQTAFTPLLRGNTDIAGKEIYLLCMVALYQIVWFVELTYGAAIYLARAKPEPT